MKRRLSSLARNLVVYGAGDAATSIVSFFLLPIYVRYLTQEDYGVISLLLTVEVVSKIIFRWGVDASFMRLYYDCPDQPARQRLASTLFLFLVAVNGSILLAGLALAPTIAGHLFGRAGYATVLRLVLANTFIVGFYFIPFHVMRITERSQQFIGLTFSRSVATLVLRLVLVVGLRRGVLGVVLADVFVTIAFTAILARWFIPLIRPVFSREVLAESLRFGLPRLPHGVAHQTIAVADRYLLTRFVSLAETGLYSVGASFGLAMKLFLSAFEYAWAPFYFGLMNEPDAKRTFSVVTTYGLAILVLLASGLTAVSGDVVRLMTRPGFFGAARYIPWIGLGVLFQGVYLLTSIGLNITKRTAYYPAATAIAAGVSVGANLFLIPRVGAIGAAWSNTLAYAVLAFVSMHFSQRFYPIRYEYGRIGRVILAGLGAWLAAWLLVPVAWRASIALLLHGTIVVVVFPALLHLLGFYDPRELRALVSLFSRVRRRRPPVAAEESTELGGELVVAATSPDETALAQDVGAEIGDTAEGPR